MTINWTWHARKRMQGRMSGLASAEQVEEAVSKCSDRLAKNGQTGVRIHRLRSTFEVAGSTGDEVWAVIDTADGPARIVTVMLRETGQRKNGHWKSEIK